MTLRASSTAAILLAGACACEPMEYGGVTADLIFEGQAGTKRQSLRAEAVPMIIDRLQIVALAADGSTLTDALGNVIETNLLANPAEGEEALLFEGGEWELARVPAGEDRSIVAQAYLGTGVDPRVAGAVAFRGRLDGITVLAGETRNAGTITLRSTGLKIPEVDMEPPTAPNPVRVEPIGAGEALRVTFGQPAGAEGYVLAVTTSSTGRDPPLIPQGTELAEGTELAPGIVVDTIWPFSGPMIIDVTGLTNDVAYTVLVYAYDTDLDGRPLNYSPAASDSDIPKDSLPPGVVQNLVVGPGADGAIIAFDEPSEDDGVPDAAAVSAYDVRASMNRGDLTNPDQFATLPTIVPPVPAAPGMLLAFERSFAELGVAPDQPFFVGVRARDAAANTGEITVAEFTANATLPPALDALDPAIAIAGREITIRGRSFGATPGTVTLTTTGTATDVFMLPVTRWENTTVVVSIPASARSGDLELKRSDGPVVSRFLPVVLRIDDAIDDYEPPFEVIGATSFNGATVISALYREAGEFSDFESAVERIVGAVPESMPFTPVLGPHSTAVAGTYSPAYDRFMFVASTDMLSMSTMFVTSSTLAPDPQRLPNGVGAGNADRVSVVFLDGGTSGRYPALLAFTLGGAIRTATVTDALIQPFNAFFATTSTLAQFDRVTIQRNAQGDVLMAHRAVSPERSELWLRLNQQGGSPDGFELVEGALRPETGPNIEIASVPLGGGPEEFVVAYEAVGPDGVIDVRLLPLSTYGLWAGYPPFVQIASDRRLEDMGLVFREGSVWIALLTSTQTGIGSSELWYTEVPFAAIEELTPRGSHPGVTLDIAPDGTRGRVACKPLPQLNCPIVWSGDDEVRVLFVRR